MMKNKKLNIEEHSKNYIAKEKKQVSTQDLTQIEKMKIIENFVENDQVLGQLLDFISQRNGQSNAQHSQSQIIDPNISMTMIDKQGNKIV